MRKIITPLLLAVLLTGCNSNSNPPVEPKDNDPGKSVPEDNDPGKSVPEDNERFKGTPLINFDGTAQDNNLYYPSNGYSNGQMFLSIWNRDNARVDNGMIGMTVNDRNNKNYGAEIRTKQGYLYGYFGAKMKTFKKSGTVQSIFTYNGGRNYAWDEIDIEFLGKDTTKVQFNYYHNGVGGHEYIYDLGFDSSLDFHDYGFLWEENSITWFVDLEPVYSVEASLPQWGFFFLNTWAGTSDTVNWLGTYTPDTSDHIAYYDYISYAPIENEKAE